MCATPKWLTRVQKTALQTVQFCGTTVVKAIFLLSFTFNFFLRGPWHPQIVKSADKVGPLYKLPSPFQC